ncbi:MAG: cupin domain-containing protein [Magnetovibrio sp.]|nr:cupin domain-containing protein [Magnetovibrio sp.]
MSAGEIVAALELAPHPEGGRYREVFRDRNGDRGRVTHIYYLLDDGEISHWHRVDAVEIWHHYAGAPLTLSVSEDGAAVCEHLLGTQLSAGQAPSAVVPAGAWQSARSRGGWALMGCTVAPAFEFEGFEMAPPGWTPTKARGSMTT